MGSACRATAPSPPASCVLLPGVNRKQLAENAQKLEQEAADAHKAAQQFNKEGRYEVSTPCRPTSQQMLHDPADSLSSPKQKHCCNGSVW